MARVDAVVTLVKRFTYEAPAYGAPWKNETHSIYKMVDDDGRIFVWKTTGVLGMDVWTPDPNAPSDMELRRWDWVGVHEGDKIRIRGTFKCITEYNGEEETELTRVKMTEKLFDAAAERDRIRKEKEAAKAATKDALLASVGDGDEIITMDYSRYKAHYSDCETVPDSYKEHLDPWGRAIKAPTIDVIVRDGRMKNSGTRGKSFRTWIMDCVINGSPVRKYVYAICPENAEKRLRKAGATDVSCAGVCHESARWID